MLGTTTVLTIVAAISLYVVFAKLVKIQWQKTPPGPFGLPVIGNLHNLAWSGNPLQVFQKWNEMYGDVVGFQLGKYNVVLLNGYENIKEAYNTWEFSGRPLLKPFHEIADGEKRGLILSEGQAWSEQRRFALRNLRDFGFGKKTMEFLLHEDISDLLSSFRELKGQPFVPHRKFSTAILRSLWEIIAGERFKYGDPKFQAVLDGLHSVVASTSITGPYVFLPWVADLFPVRTGWVHFKENIARAKNLVREYLDEHRKTFDINNIRDFIDIHMKEQKETVDPNSSFYKDKGGEICFHELPDKNLLVGVLNLLGAGAETTSSTLVWSLLYLIKNPEVQQNVYKEIQKVVGSTRLPSLEDRDSCIYTWAVMEEVLRFSTLTPFGVMHNTMNDTTFKGFFIPKDTLVMANLYGVHYNKKQWKDPENFRPERFLTVDNNGKYIKRTDAGPVLAFSVGKRACLGEVLARNNFFLYLTSLVQVFEFSSNDELSLEGNLGLVRTPSKFSIVIRERNE